MNTPTRRPIVYILSILSVVCLIGQSAQATLFFEEGFNYATGGLATVGGFPFGPWTGGNANITVASGNLTYPSLADAAAPGNQLSIISGVAAGSTAANFSASPITGGTVYYSFLAQATALPTSNQYLTSLLPTGATGPNGGTDPLAVYVGQQVAGSQFKIGIRHQGIGTGATYASTSALTLNTINLFVVSYTFNPSTGDDSVSLFINPTPGGPQPAADVSVSGGGTDAANLQEVGFKAQSSSGAGNWIFDTLRIGDTWADVIPAAIPEPSALALIGLGVVGLISSRRARR